MNCMSCGAVVSENTRFCPSCGAEQQQQKQSVPINQHLIGYSSRINDPKIKAAMKKNARAGIIFTVILAIVAVIGFTVVGALQVGGFELPSALYIGLGFGALLLVIAGFQSIKAKKDKSWDGVVIDKKTKHPSFSSRRDGNYTTQFSVTFRLDTGDIKTISMTEDLYHYYQINDRVRHHAGTPSHITEKYDKSRDDKIYCVVCTSKNDISADVCHRCHSPLLK